MDPENTDPTNPAPTAPAPGQAPAPEGMPPDEPDDDVPAEGEEAPAGDPDPAAEEAALASNPAVQRMIKKAADKLARETEQKKAEAAAKKARLAKMSDDQRAAAEKLEIEQQRDEAQRDAASARVELDFYRGLSRAKLHPVDDDAAEFIKQAAVKIAEDEGIDLLNAIAEVAKRKAYLFVPATEPAPAVDPANPPAPRAAAPTRAPTPAAPRPSSAPRPARDNAAPPTGTKPPVDARKLTGPEFLAHLQNEHNLPGVPL